MDMAILINVQDFGGDPAATGKSQCIGGFLQQTQNAACFFTDFNNSRCFHAKSSKKQH